MSHVDSPVGSHRAVVAIIVIRICLVGWVDNNSWRETRQAGDNSWFDTYIEMSWEWEKANCDPPTQHTKIIRSDESWMYWEIITHSSTHMYIW